MDIDLFSDSSSTQVILSKQEKKKVETLERIISHLSKLHGQGDLCIHPDTKQVVSDFEFDSYVKELSKLSPNSNIFTQNLSAPDLDAHASKIKHDPPMTSIKKANGTEREKQEILDKFIKDYSDEFNISQEKAKKNLVVSYKHDGVACSVIYKNGKLVAAGLRPRDGVYGEDITENIKYVKDIPSQLPLDIDCIIRGELECKISTFNKLNGSDEVDNQEFANARNYTTGSIRQYKEPNKTKSRQLSFTAYSILNLSNAPYKTERERAIWCNKTLKIPFVRTEFLYDSLLSELEDKVTELDYEVDGAVISINNLEEQEQMGSHGSATNAIPKGKIAWKFADETANPVISEIMWHTGRTGQIVPVCHFNSVKLAGTSVQKAAAHSLGFLVRNNIKVGTKVRIRKSGKIIPQVLGIVKDKTFIPNITGGNDDLPKQFDFSKHDYPKTCPSCGNKTEIEHGQKHGLIELRCDNDVCAAKNIKKFMNYLEKFGVKGIGEATVTRWVEAGLVTKLSDFYTLNILDLLKEGETKRTALLSIARIHMVQQPEQVKDNRQLSLKTVDAIKQKKNITLSKFIACLGIPGASRGTGTALSTHFRNLNDILNADENELLSVADIGTKTAKTLHEYINQNKNDIDSLVSDHLNVQMPKQGLYTGKSFVFTGSQVEGKEYWKDAVEQEGGIVKTSVSKKTDYVVVGTDPGSKFDKAKSLKAEGFDITIIEDRGALKDMFKGY